MNFANYEELTGSPVHGLFIVNEQCVCIAQTVHSQDICLSVCYTSHLCLIGWTYH